MSRLIQIIGPMSCGKTMLWRSFCPGAIDICSCLQGNFNEYMIGAPGYYFQEMTLTKRMMAKLIEWVGSKNLIIHRMGNTPITIPNPGIWIYEGLEPIYFKDSLIWNVQKC